MKKRILVMLLAAMLMVSLLPVSALAADATSGTCGENVTWSFDEGSGTLTISGTGEMEDYMGVSSPPWDDLKVKNLKINSGITSIGHGAFERCEIKSVVIPEGVTVINNVAFMECRYLTSVQLPTTLTRIGGDAFAYCERLTEIRIPASVSDLGSSMFVEYDNVFRGCGNLSKFQVDGSPYFSTDEYGVLYNKDKTALVAAPIKLDGVYKVPNSVRHIAANAFERCGITGLVLSENLEMIPRWMCFNCQDIKFLYIPASVRTIENNAFSSCGNLSDVYYGGSEKAWNTMVEYRVEFGNEYLLGANIHFNAEAPNVPCSHKSETVKGKAATCTATGLTDGSKCSVCGEVLKAQEEIPVKAHSFKDGKCSVCGAKDPNYVEPTPTPPAGDNPFTDVPNDAWYAAPVLWAKANNVTGGTSATTFGPDDSCTRAQVVTFLWAANGKPEPKSMNNPFKDVANNAWYLKPVLWAVEQGITGGIAEGKFGPEQTCTRAQIATFLYAAAGKPEVSGKSSFKDVKDADWFAKPIIWAAQNEVTGGIGDGKFGPNNTCTRAQVVTFLYKVYGNN